MTNEPTNAVRGAPAGDTPVEPEVHDELPEHLDLPLEVPEADALEQELEVPTADDER
jgi:hypothetical protein